MTPCAPFTVTRHHGMAWITRDKRERVAPPEVVALWEQRAEALVTLCEVAAGDKGGLVVWGIEGQGWQNDPDMLRLAAEALQARARAIEARLERAA